MSLGAGNEIRIWRPPIEIQGVSVIKKIEMNLILDLFSPHIKRQ